MITIDKLRTQREKMGVSYQWIADETEKIGCAVSITTIKRVFSAESSDDMFKRSSLNAIAKALDIYEDDEELEKLRQLLSEKEKRISELEKKIIDTAEYTEGRLNYLKETDKSKYDFILKQEKKIIHKDRIILCLSIVIALCLLTDIIALAYDAMNPGTGYLRAGLFSPALVAFMCVIVSGIVILVLLIDRWIRGKKEDRNDM